MWIANKKVGVWTLLVIYILSYFMQSFFFATPNALAEDSFKHTNLVAVLVDNSIYDSVKGDIDRYAQNYIQGQISDSRALVLPINTKNFKAKDVVKMLENLYFDGVEGEASKLVGLVLVGDIPLPVVQNKGYVYPSIYPYVDFENQQFIYDSTSDFFVYNNVPNGQAEVWHGIINYGKTIAQYQSFFKKLQTYTNNPSAFVAAKIWYDDFVAIKSAFVPENLSYYINSLLFAEDMGYHRYTNLLIDLIKADQDKENKNLGDQLIQSTKQTDGGSAGLLETLQDQATAALDKMGSSKVPTTMIISVVKELMKGYDTLLGGKYLSKMRDNLQVSSRRSEVGSDGNMQVVVDTHASKIAQKDQWLVGNSSAGLDPLLVQLNNDMEKSLDQSIASGQYYMMQPVLSEYNHSKSTKGKDYPVSLSDPIEAIKMKTFLRYACLVEFDDTYKNYYFGTPVAQITSPQGASIYRGTFKNITQLSDAELVTNQTKSFGGSYNIFATQVQGNQGFNLMAAKSQADFYNAHKQSTTYTLDCALPSLPFSFLNSIERLLCVKRQYKFNDDKSDKNSCYRMNNGNMTGDSCEPIKDFANRNWGGAATVNLDTGLQAQGIYKLETYDPSKARYPIYDIGGAKALDSSQESANSFRAYDAYGSLNKISFKDGVVRYFTNPLNLSDYSFFTIYGNKALPEKGSARISESTIPRSSNNITLVNSTNPSNDGGIFSKPCGFETSIYKYKILDTRLKNTSVTPDQINGAEESDFEEGALFWRHYDFLNSQFSNLEYQTQNNQPILSGNGSLLDIKSSLISIDSRINSFVQLVTGNVNSLLASVNAIVDSSTINTISNQVSNTTGYLEDFQVSLNSLNVEPINIYFDTIKETEVYTQKKTQFLKSWLSEINPTIDSANAGFYNLKTKFNQFKAVYNDLPLSFNVTALQTKKTAVNNLQTCGTYPNTYVCGCANTYKSVCDKIDDLITTSFPDVNARVSLVKYYSGYDSLGVWVNLDRLAGIDSDFSSSVFPTSLAGAKTYINKQNKIIGQNGFDIVDSPSTYEIPGMNMMTIDRPIDSPRYVTFKGIGSNVVTFAYPNLYQVSVFSQSGAVLSLKSIPDIQQSIKKYLVDKIDEYNNKLQKEQSAASAYYQTSQAAFDFLATQNSLATPNRTYNLLPRDLFITRLGDTRIKELAEALYYQNLPVYQRRVSESVKDDMASLRSSFDPNQKVAYVVDTYLRQNNNQGAFSTPTYNASGYEVAFLNSDGSDYMDVQGVPAFITKLKDYQDQQNANPKPKSNVFLEESDYANVNQSTADTSAQCGHEGSYLIFDLDSDLPYKSPWYNALQCWWKSLKNSVRFNLQFKTSTKDDASPGEFFSELKRTFDDWKNSFSVVGGSQEEQSANEETLQSLSSNQRTILNDVYMKSILDVSTSPWQLGSGDVDHIFKLSTSEDLGSVFVRISSTGDFCLPFVNSSLCDPVERTVNLFSEPLKFSFKPLSKAGFAKVLVELCLPSDHKKCVSKQQIIEVLPGAITKTELIIPSRVVMAGVQIPIGVSAKDDWGNQILKTTDVFSVSVGSGQGSFLGGVGSSSPEVTQFGSSPLIYTAPSDFDNKQVSLLLSGINAQGKSVSVSQNVTIKKGFLSLNSGSSSIEFQLQDFDANTGTLPQITFSLKSKDGSSLLDAPVRISSKNGLVVPGTFEDGKFRQVYQGLITSGKLSLSLYPSYVAGEDELTFDVPGLKPQTLKIIVHAGQARAVALNFSRDSLALRQSLTGSVRVLDNWGNALDKPTTLVLGAIGSVRVAAPQEISLGSGQFSFAVQSSDNAGVGYAFAYIKDVPLTGQIPAYKKYMVQGSFVPRSGMNVMYANLFGTDRGNQWGYFSENSGYVSTLMASSDKMLAATTQLVDPTKLKQLTAIVDERGQVKNIGNNTLSLIADQGKFYASFDTIGRVDLGKLSDFSIKQVANQDQFFVELGAITNKNSLVYLPNPIDSVINSQEVRGNKLFVNNQLVLDLSAGVMTAIELQFARNDKGYSIWNVLDGGIQIGQLALWRGDDYVLNNIHNTQISNLLTWDKRVVFAQGSTNGTKGIGIYDITSVFQKQGYQSIEDSNDGALGIGFSADFKNITLFADGQSVGESTLPFGSQFLINYGDPLLKRIGSNKQIPALKLDTSIGEAVYSDPTKSIFKTLPIDFNNDGFQDLITAYTDGTVVLLKNYGGTDGFKNLQNLMVIATTIKDISVGDVDGNGYPDILIWTTTNQVRVYKNNKGIYDVDGKLVCLNTSVDTGKEKSNPSDMSDLKQLFFEDMDKDNKLDIVTNDSFGDVKIFYGGSSNAGDFYVSKLDYTCDAGWLDRQKNNVQLVKRFGVIVDDSLRVQDKSLIHIASDGWYIKDEDMGDIGDNEPEESPSAGDGPNVTLPGGGTMDLNTSSTSDLVGALTNDFLDLANQELSTILVDNPLTISPSYEANLPFYSIGYKTLISLSGEKKIAVYKQFKNLNGGILQSGNIVQVTVTVQSLQDNLKASYIESLDGPFDVPLNATGAIDGFAFSGSAGSSSVVWDMGDTDYLFMVDTIQLNKNQKQVFSYKVVYKGKTSLDIDVKDTDLLDASPRRRKDGYADIIVTPQDGCKKYRWIYFNTLNSSLGYRGYESVFDNIQAKIDAYVAQGQKTADNAMNNAVPVPKTNSDGSIDVDSVLNNPSLKSTMEAWNVKDLLKQSVQGGANFEINTDAINDMTKGLEDKTNQALNGLCQGFKLGKGGCQPPVPINYIPFNQAFLFPGDYNIFGCKKIPLKPLNKGMPVLFAPAAMFIGVPPTYIPMIGSAFLPTPFMRGGIPIPTDNFYMPLSPTLAPLPPSQFRLYVGPTLTMQLGIAMCFGPYTVGAAIPKPFRDVGGNCVVTVVPLLSCDADNSNVGADDATTESLDPYIVDSSSSSSSAACDGGPKVGNTLRFEDGAYVSDVTTASPFMLSYLSDGFTYPAPMVPQGNFFGMGNVTMSEKPTKKTFALPSFGNGNKVTGGLEFKPFEFREGERITLKVLGADAKGIIKKVMTDWFGRQIKYIINNLSKFTIGITLPDLSDLGKGFDGLVSTDEWKDAWKSAIANDVDTTNNSGLLNKDIPNIPPLQKIKKIDSKQQLANISNAVNNPFDAVIGMFDAVPLVKLHTRDVNIKIPMIYSEDIINYTNYLNTWLGNQMKVLRRWLYSLSDVFALCGTITQQEAKSNLADMAQEKKDIETLSAGTLKTKLQQSWDKEFADLTTIVNSKSAIASNNILKDCLDKKGIVQDMKCLMDNGTGLDLTEDIIWSGVKANVSLTARRLWYLPRLKRVQTTLEAKKSAKSVFNKKITDEEIARLNRVDKRIQKLNACGSVMSNMDSFVKFYSDTSILTKNVKQNIKVLEAYKRFPTQLYSWMHLTDRYFSDLMSFVSNTVFVLMNWLNVNAKAYSNYVDALITILSAIKTRQILMDFSINWSKKCAKCTIDSYGSHSCGLAILANGIKFPILPLPPFKIPSIYLDLSHVDLGISLEIPKFNFVPTKLALPQLPNLPNPPSVEVNLGLDVSADLAGNFFGQLSIPTIPVLPSPPTLPQLPSFIPTVDFSLPTLPPAPKMPNLIPQVKTILDSVNIIAKFYCIVKSGIGLVAEKAVKARVEQLSQRTWEVPVFDSIDMTTKWKKDLPPKGFDFKLDSYLQFKMDFEAFYNFLDSVVGIVNGLSSKMENVSSEWAEKVSSQSADYMDNIQQDIRNVDVNLQFKSNFDIDTKQLQGFADPEKDWIDADVGLKQLKQGLYAFQNLAQDTPFASQVESILVDVETKSRVVPASKEIDTVHKQVRSVLQKHQKETNDIADRIKHNYDGFLKSLGSGIQLVAHDSLDQTFSTPLLLIDQKSRSIIENAESPTKSYLDLNSRMVNGNLSTLYSSTADELSMLPEDKSASISYFEGLNSKLQYAYDSLGFKKESKYFCATPGIFDAQEAGASSVLDAAVPVQKPLIAQSSSSSSSSSTSAASSNYDLSSFVRGIFVEAYSGSDSKSMVNVVASDEYDTKIGKNYKLLDINKDKVDDVLMRDAHTVYVKYGNQNPLYGQRQNNTRYYAWDKGFNDPSELVSSTNNGYLTIHGIGFKISSDVSEVKNFVMNGQNFDSIMFSFANSVARGESVDGYLVKLQHRVDSADLKDRLLNFLNDSELHKRYVLILPKGTSYDKVLLDPGEVYSNGYHGPRTISSFLTGSYSGMIYAVQYYDPNQTKITLSLSEVPRNWQYAEVAPLKQTLISRSSGYVIAGPWSNQVVAGRQLLGDTVGPVGSPQLFRISTQQAVASGNQLQGFVGTRYALQADRKDNLAVKYMWIEQDNKTIAYASGGIGSTGFISIPGLFFTGATSKQYIFGAEDYNGNQQLQTVTLNIVAPDISITSLDVLDPGTDSQARVIAQLSHDIDEGNVLFQRLRNSKWTEITGTTANKLGGWPVIPGQTIVTGQVFSIGNDVGLYNSAGAQVATMRHDGKLTLMSGYDLDVKLRFDTSASMLEVTDKNLQNNVFQIYLPSGILLGKPQLRQGVGLYELMSLDQNYGNFADGYCVKTLDKQCMIFIGKNGNVYVPKEYASSIVGNYRFDDQQKAIVYEIRDLRGNPIVDVTLQAEMFGQ